MWKRNKFAAICLSIILCVDLLGRYNSLPVITEAKTIETNEIIETNIGDGPLLRTIPEVISVRDTIGEEVYLAEAVIEEELYLTDEEIELIALVTMAEAEGESDEGKRLVIDTILNRVDHDKFPNTVTDVIYQPHQFSSMWNGRVDRCYVMDDIVELVKEELRSRTNYEVIFFTAGQYGKYGEPMFRVENHYFCSYS